MGDRLTSLLAGASDLETAARAARVGAMLARLPRGADYSIERIGADAARIIHGAIGARAALAASDRKAYKRHAAIVRGLGLFYGASLVPRGDLNGMVFGLQLPPGSLKCGKPDLLFLS